MKTPILLFAALLTTTLASGQNIEIPDTAFLYALIDEGVDTDEDSLISFAEAEAVTSLIVHGKNISDLTGIEAFVNLEALNCSNNNISSLDVSNNTILTNLHCSLNKLNSLDISNHFALVELFCDENHITSLNASNNPHLKYIVCPDNQLLNLDLSNCTELVWLYCSRNLLTSLDISSNHQIGEVNWGSGLIITDMPSLYEVCVWEGFSPNDCANTENSPNVFFTRVCGAVPTTASEEINSIRIYPNPVSDKLSIEFIKESARYTSIILFDISGKEVHSELLDNTLLTHTIDLSSMGEGIYFIHIIDNQYIYSEKVVKVE